MKKQYMRPQIEVMKVDNIRLLSGSDIKLGGGSTNQQFSREVYWDEEE